MPCYAIWAVGRDRPGIVAEVTGALVRHDANLEDSQMGILRGHFTMMLVVSAPEGADAGALRADLEALRERLGLEGLALAEVPDAAAGVAPAPTHIVTVYGADHPGIVHAVSVALAGRGVNITDLATRLLGEAEGEPLYVMLLEVAPPPGVAAAELREALAGVGRDQGVEVTVRELERDVL